jgi:hypothetical protein
MMRKRMIALMIFCLLGGARLVAMEDKVVKHFQQKYGLREKEAADLVSTLDSRMGMAFMGLDDFDPISQCEPCKGGRAWIIAQSQSCD